MSKGVKSSATACSWRTPTLLTSESKVIKLRLFFIMFNVRRVSTAESRNKVNVPVRYYRASWGGTPQERANQTK